MPRGALADRRLLDGRGAFVLVRNIHGKSSSMLAIDSSLAASPPPAIQTCRQIQGL